MPFWGRSIGEEPGLFPEVLIFENPVWMLHFERKSLILGLKTKAISKDNFCLMNMLDTEAGLVYKSERL
jgi:hypothetical protein